MLWASSLRYCHSALIGLSGFDTELVRSLPYVEYLVSQIEPLNLDFIVVPPNMLLLKFYPREAL